MKKIVLMLMILGMASVAYAGDLLDQAQSLASLEEADDFLKTIGNPVTDEKKLAIGIAQHSRIQFIAESSDKTFKLIQETIVLLKSLSDNPLALGYLGSTQTLLGGWYSDNKKILRAAKELFTGIANMDKAVKQAPKLIDLRILRVFNSLSITESSPANREDEIEDDLKALKNLLPKNDSHLQCLYYYVAGSFAEIKGKWRKAVKSYETAVALMPDSSFGKMAADRLKSLEE